MVVFLVKSLVLIGALLTAAAYLVLLERRFAAWVQERLGPNRVGVPLTTIRLGGLGQPLADGVKLILKEEYTPRHVDRILYTLAPIVTLVAAVAVFAVIPFGCAPGEDGPAPLVLVSGLDVGLIYIFALNGLAVYGVILGGWASNNKYSFLGALRSSAQLIAYELPLGLGVLGVVAAAGSLDLEAVIEAQAESGVWFAFTQPLGLAVFLAAVCAEAGRLPFDLPECEQELVGGYHTEYSGVRLLLFLVGEFLHMVTAALLIVILFLGGWHLWWIAPLRSGVGWAGALVRVAVLLGKVLLVILGFMLARWTWPRFRFDQLMGLAWKVLLPLGLIHLLVVGVVGELGWILGTGGAPGWNAAMAAIGWLVLLGAAAVLALWGPPLADNRPVPASALWEGEGR